MGSSAPVRVLSGYIGRVTVSVPWTALLKDSCKVEISGLALSIVPYIAPSAAADEQGGQWLCAHAGISLTLTVK